jgi:ribosomal-protein-alanine N-acetyltransferase
MPYILENMAQADIPEVASIERLCFSMPWPTSAYRRELKTPETNRYIVARFVPPSFASSVVMPVPTESNLTSLVHPEFRHSENGHEDQSQPEQSSRSFLSSLLPWLRNDSTGNNKPPPSGLPIAGYAGLWLMLDEAHVTTIGVHPHHRGQGIGELLFLGLADIARQMRAFKMTLEVRVSNLPAQALYRKYGLEIAGVRKRYYSDNGEDAYIMWSEPIPSQQFQQRIEELRAKLAIRLQRSFHQVEAPARPINSAGLQ